jgi:hypothetical protein
MSNSKAFDSILIIMFENENANLVLDNEYFKEKAQQGVRLTNNKGVTHPSQPNYLATIAGSYFDRDTDDPVEIDHHKTIVDLLEKKEIDWKVYMEDLPDKYNRDKLTVVSSNKLYYRKHNPFVSFKRNQTTIRLNKIVNAEKNFENDVDADTVPPFAWYGPNIQNCGHTVPTNPRVAGDSIKNIDFAAAWLKCFLEPLLNNSSFMKNRLIVLTFDEDYPILPDHQLAPIYTVLLGDMVINPGTTQAGAYNHYSLLATIEKNFSLGNLGQNDKDASTFDFLWEPLAL